MASHKKTDVLIVDDREANLTAMEAVLDEPDWNVVKARSGKEALLRFQERDFAVILLDVQMPGMDGFETATLIRGGEQSFHTPIVFVTAIRTEDADIGRGYSLGATDYIVKPFSAPEIKAKVRAYVELYKRRKELAGKLRGLMGARQEAHILAVDDQPGNLAAIAESLAPLKEKVHTAQSGQDALKLLLKHDFALIIADVRMPGMDGFALAEMIKQNRRYEQVPILFVSAVAHAPDDVVRGYKAGAVDYIFSPCDPEILRTKVGALLSLVKQRMALEAQIREIERLNERLRNSELALERLNETLEDRIYERTSALAESEKKYRSLFESIVDVFYQTDAEGVLTVVSPSVERMLGYRPEEVIGKRLRDFYVRPEERERFHSRLQEAGGELEYESSLRAKDGTEVFVSAHAGFYRDGQGRVLGVQGVARDITKRKEAEEKLRATLANLRKATGAIVQVMASTAEMRDPYTAGHQVRCADLARAIAVEMKLAQNEIDAVRMAGAIHDIGKIAVPAEILSKPTKLSDIEFALVREHAPRGYEMLKDVEFPWPLAEIVHQHHERMNGAGYPRGLKGEDIRIEARILAVADTVEAMASHRPYRPAIGIDAALAEIERGRGVLYDAAVAQTCLRLFREKGYRLPE